MGRAYLFKRATGGAVASPFEGGLGGSAPLLVRFLGASEKMNNTFCFFFKKKAGVNRSTACTTPQTCEVLLAT